MKQMIGTKRRRNTFSLTDLVWLSNNDNFGHACQRLCSSLLGTCVAAACRKILRR